MLVSTLVFILIGFMCFVLFSMIPVVWRIRTDFFGTGDRSHGRYIRDFDDQYEPGEDSAGPDFDGSPSSNQPEKAEPAL